MWTTAALLAHDASAASAPPSATTESSAPDATAQDNAASSSLATPRTALYGHEEGVNDASWSHDGCYLVSASDDKTARIWDVEYSKTLSTLGRTSSSMSAFNAHGIAVDTGELTSHSSENDGHASYVFSAQFNPQGSLIVTASYDETVRFWDVRTGRSVAVLSAHHEPIVSARFSHDGSLLVTSSYDGLARIWDVATRECLRTMITEPSVPLTHAQFTPNSRYVLFGTLDSRLQLWDFARECVVQTYKGHVSKRFCSVAAFGRQRVSSRADAVTAVVMNGSEDGRVCLWDVQSGELVDSLSSPSPRSTTATMTTATAPVIAADFHPHAPVIAASAGTAISVWEQCPAPAASVPAPLATTTTAS